MSKKKTDKEQRNEKGQFVEGNTAGDKFDEENEAASKYKEEYCEQMLDYFSKQPVNEVDYRETYNRDGDVTSRTPVILPGQYPTFELFAASIGVTTRTLENWAKKHRRFSYYYARAKEIQLGKLTTNAVMGLYNPVYAKFEAVNNHNQKDKSEVETNIKSGMVDEKTLELLRNLETRLNAKKE